MRPSRPRRRDGTASTRPRCGCSAAHTPGRAGAAPGGAARMVVQPLVAERVPALPAPVRVLARVPDPVGRAKGFFEFGTRSTARSRRSRRRGGRLAPAGGGRARLRGARRRRSTSAGTRARTPTRRRPSTTSARSEPALRRFYERELASASQAIAFEQGFEFELDAGDGQEPVRLRGDHRPHRPPPDGSIEVIDYKTGRSKSPGRRRPRRAAVALRAGAARGRRPDPVGGEPCRRRPG